MRLGAHAEGVSPAVAVRKSFVRHLWCARQTRKRAHSAHYSVLICFQAGLATPSDRAPQGAPPRLSYRSRLLYRKTRLPLCCCKGRLQVGADLPPLWMRRLLHAEEASVARMLSIDSVKASLSLSQLLCASNVETEPRLSDVISGFCGHDRNTATSSSRIISDVSRLVRKQRCVNECIVSRLP